MPLAPSALDPDTQFLANVARAAQVTKVISEFGHTVCTTSLCKPLSCFGLPLVLAGWYTSVRLLGEPGVGSIEAYTLGRFYRLEGTLRCVLDITHVACPPWPVKRLGQ